MNKAATNLFSWCHVLFFRMQASRRSVKAHFGSIGSSLSTGFQVYLSKCWDPYVSPGCTMRLVFLCGLSTLFQHVDLATTSFRAGFQVYLSYPWFCVGRPRQYDTICWELNLISGFVAFLCLIVSVDGIDNCGWYLAGDADSRARTRSQV